MSSAELLLRNELKLHYNSNQIDFIWRCILEDVFIARSFKEVRQKQDYVELILPRLMAGEPIQYITGKSYFYDRLIVVNKHVLIPRSETEILVENAIKAVKVDSSFLNILDIGTGSGCIPIVLKAHCPEVKIQAIDISKDALQIAKTNAASHQVQIDFVQLDFLQSDYWDQLRTPDLIVSNPPYILKSEQKFMSSSALDYEPDEALYASSNDPLIFYKKIEELASSYRKFPILILELNEFKSQEIKDIFSSYKTNVIQDLEGRDRVIEVCK